LKIKRLFRRHCLHCDASFRLTEGHPGLFSKREEYCSFDCMAAAWRALVKQGILY
jgi:hypothetical protein